MTPIMIAPAGAPTASSAGPATPTGAGTGGDSFAAVLAGEQPTVATQPGPVAGQPTAANSASAGRLVAHPIRHPAPTDAKAADAKAGDPAGASASQPAYTVPLPTLPQLTALAAAPVSTTASGTSQPGAPTETGSPAAATVAAVATVAGPGAVAGPGTVASAGPVNEVVPATGSGSSLSTLPPASDAGPAQPAAMGPGTVRLASSGQVARTAQAGSAQPSGNQASDQPSVTGPVGNATLTGTLPVAAAAGSVHVPTLPLTAGALELPDGALSAVGQLAPRPHAEGGAAGGGQHGGSAGHSGSSGRPDFSVELPAQNPLTLPASGLAPATGVAASTVPAGVPMVNLQPAATPVTAPSGSTAAQPTLTPATPQPVTHQLAGPVLNLRASGDGSHQLTIALHPAELGPVNLHVRILGDSMAIQLSSTSEGAHDAMRDALPQLRHELEAAGLSSVDLSLDLGASTSGGSAGSGGAADSRGQGDGARSNANPDQARATTQPHRDDRPRANSDSGLDRWL